MCRVGARGGGARGAAGALSRALCGEAAWMREECAEVARERRGERVGTVRGERRRAGPAGSGAACGLCARGWAAGRGARQRRRRVCGAAYPRGGWQCDVRRGRGVRARPAHRRRGGRGRAKVAVREGAGAGRGEAGVPAQAAAEVFVPRGLAGGGTKSGSAAAGAVPGAGGGTALPPRATRPLVPPRADAPRWHRVALAIGLSSDEENSGPRRD